MSQVLDAVRAFLTRRKLAYCQVFKPESEATKKVLSDLARFCRANESTFHADPRLHAVLEGRRETFLRITRHLNLSPEELMEIYSKKGAE